jgi:hypothetical protein
MLETFMREEEIDLSHTPSLIVLTIMLPSCKVSSQKVVGKNLMEKLLEVQN